jgi:RNA polymerase-interacting CarD/CdnL/TRCF family regulator
MAKLRPVLTQPELEALMASEDVRRYSLTGEESLRKQLYRDLIGSGDRSTLLRMVYSLYRYRDEQTAAGRKFHQCDENFLHDAERLLCSEISLVLNLDAEQARAYLRRQLG